MATRKQFVDFVVAQIDYAGTMAARKMFGEYALYAGEKIVALICDDKLFVKPTAAGRAYIKDVVERSPYPGAKPGFLIEEKIEDRTWLSELICLTYNELPEPKPKKKKG